MYLHSLSAELVFRSQNRVVKNVIVIIQIVKYMEMPKGKSVAILIKLYLHFSPRCERQLTFYFHYTLHINIVQFFFNLYSQLHCGKKYLKGYFYKYKLRLACLPVLASVFLKIYIKIKASIKYF